MAKAKGNLSSIFKSTERKPAAVASVPAALSPRAGMATGRTISVGVGLKESEVAELDAMAAELGLARNALMGWALRYFLAEVRSGRLDLAAQLEEKTTRQLRKL